MEDYTKACPYCGQVNLSGEDARGLCGCFKAVKYRKIRRALDEVGVDVAPMPDIDEDVMVALGGIAHLIVMGRISSAAVKLGDGTAVSVGGKVSRKATVKMERKVDE